MMFFAAGQPAGLRKWLVVVYHDWHTEGPSQLSLNKIESSGAEFFCLIGSAKRSSQNN
jgi:hypothetical protein